MRPARPRARPRPPSAPPAAPEVEAEGVEIVTPDVARLRRVLELTAAGRSQADIARVLGCSERTVGRLLKTARQRETATFRARSPESLLADVETKAAAQYARWSTLWARARASGDLRAEIAALSRMDQALWGRVAMLARVGFFDSANFAGHGGEDESSRRAQQDRAEIDFLVSLSAATNRGEDVSGMTMPEPLDATDIEDLEPLY